MTEQTVYSVDTSALIDGLERYYPAKSFPGVWDAIDELVAAGRFIASEEVWEEAKKKDEVVKAWLDPRREQVIAPTDDDVLAATREILADYPRLAMSGAGRNRADPFVVAVAETRAATVVTGEGHDGNDRRPKIPYVCGGRGIQCIRFTGLIAAEGWSFARTYDG